MEGQRFSAGRAWICWSLLFVWISGAFGEDIFPPQSKHVHGSSIVECPSEPSGRFLACWFHGSGERSADDVCIQGSWYDLSQKSWGPVFLMADTPQLPDCNPVLFVDRQKRLWLFWIRVLANRWECCQLMYRRAEERDLGGEGPPHWSWQDCIVLKPGDDFAKELRKGFDNLGFRQSMWGEYAKPYDKTLVEAAQDPYKRQTGWMTRIHPLQLPTGRILLPLYSDGFNVSLVAISDDDGETWRPSSPIVGLGPIQPSLVRDCRGRMWAFCRDAGNLPKRVMRSCSEDDGETWSLARDTEIPNPGSSLEVIRLRDGAWLYVGNDTDWGRGRLSAWISLDEGRTWPYHHVLEKAGEDWRSFSYPSVLQDRQGRIHVTYSCSGSRGATIRHLSLDQAWLCRNESEKPKGEARDPLTAR